MSYIIIHYQNNELLLACLESIRQNIACLRSGMFKETVSCCDSVENPGGKDVPFNDRDNFLIPQKGFSEKISEESNDNCEILIVNNGCEEKSFQKIIKGFPEVKVIQNPKNEGFAEGCNIGIRAAAGKYLILLNNDIQLAPDCMGHLLDFISQRTDKIGLLQPKILSLDERGTFEYSGAAGGLMDILGYPFAQGRLFFTTERDEGQFNKSGEIFWASGAALFAPKAVLEEVGMFDTDFFAYMEEIDLAWRVHLRGYKVVYVPQAKVYHLGCSVLNRKSMIHMYLNHRNSLMMLLKNYSWPFLISLLPLRLMLEVLTMLNSLLFQDRVQAKAILKAFWYLFSHPANIWAKRKKTRALRQVSNLKVMRRMYWGSIAIQYFLLGKRVVRGNPHKLKSNK
jgi:GT2 family glycosyltransferase